MRDTRTDSGQYYPGGRIVSRGGTVPPQGTIRWTDITGKPNFSDVADLTSDDGQGKVKEVVNTIKERMSR